MSYWRSNQEVTLMFLIDSIIIRPIVAIICSLLMLALVPVLIVDWARGRLNDSQ
jgi:hypothetical protein